MTTLPAEFGLSDVARHKICRKHDVGLERDRRQTLALAKRTIATASIYAMRVAKSLPRRP